MRARIESKLLLLAYDQVNVDRGSGRNAPLRRYRGKLCAHYRTVNPHRYQSAIAVIRQNVLQVRIVRCNCSGSSKKITMLGSHRAYESDGIASSVKSVVMRLGWRFFVFGECFQEPIDEGQVGAFSGRMEFDFSSFDDDEPNRVKDSASSELDEERA